MIQIDRIRTDGGTQSRVQLNDDVVAEYAEAYRAGVDMPPVVLFFDKKDFWLADGFHRVAGAKAAGQDKILERIEPGTRRDAILYSLGANGAHGLRRSNADKRKAVETMLRDPEWATWSDSRVAKACGVDHKTVAAHRTAILGNSQDAAPAPRRVERGGVTYQQDTSRIGKSRPGASSTSHAGRAAAATGQDGAANQPLPRGETPASTPGCLPLGSRSAGGQAEVILQLQDQVLTLTEQLESVNEDMATLAKVADADDKVAAAVAEAKKYRDLARGLQARVNSMTDQIAELKRTVASQKKRLEAEAA